MAIFGIDSAHWQGVLPVSQLEAAGLSFAIVKATHGASASPDSQFKTSWKRLSDSPILQSAYGWFTDADPNLQAEAMIRAVERVQDCDIPLGVDFEEPSTIFRGNELLDRLRVMLARVRQLSGQRKILLYSGAWYIDKFVGDVPMDDIIEENFYWHSEYPRLILRDKRACGLLPPELPKPRLPRAWIKKGAEETIWQYDGTGGCVLPNGVDADFNIFNGTVEEMRALLPSFEVADTVPAGPIEYIDPTATLAGEFVKTLPSD